MNEERRAYDLPLTKEKWRFWLLLAAMPLLILAFEWRRVDSGFDPEASAVIRYAYLLFLIPLALDFGNCFGKLHLVPEGIAVTIFGKTIRRIPKEEIHFLGGLAYTRKGNSYKWICVCNRSMYQLAEEQERKTPKMFQDSCIRSGWCEDMAGKCLRGYADSMTSGMGFPRKDILLIEWAPERLELLLQMYPGVPWTDLTEKKVLDAERIG